MLSQKVCTSQKLKPIRILVPVQILHLDVGLSILQNPLQTSKSHGSIPFRKMFYNLHLMLCAVQYVKAAVQPNFFFCCFLSFFPPFPSYMLHKKCCHKIKKVKLNKIILYFFIIIISRLYNSKNFCTQNYKKSS